MKCFSILYLLLLVTFFSNAQSNYKPGYVVNNQNDTIKGFIDQREQYNNPTEFQLKTGPNQQITKYPIADIKAVGIIGYNYYEKFTTSVSTGYITINRLSSSIDTGYNIKTIFLRLIKKGSKVSLYAYTDNIKTRYYIFESAETKLTELKYFVYLDPETRSVVNAYRYRLQLHELTDKYQLGNPGVVERITNAAYDEIDLLKIVQLIDGDKADGKSVSKNLSGQRFFVGAGLTSSKLTFNGETLAFQDGTSKTSISPTLSGGIDFILNKETQKVIFRLEAAIAENDYNLKNVPIQNVIDQTFASTDVKMFTTTVRPQIIYNFLSTDAIKIFLDAGIAFNITGYNNYNYTTNEIINSTITITNTKNKFPVFQGTSFSVPLKLGIVVSKCIEIYATYCTPASITRYEGSSASISSLQAGVNYLFK